MWFSNCDKRNVPQKMSQTGLAWRLATLPKRHKMKTQYINICFIYKQEVYFCVKLLKWI